jgi:hypothetical protein
MAAVDVQVVARPAPWTSQTVGVEPGQELGVAGVLIQEIGDGEVHGKTLHFGREAYAPHYTPTTSDGQYRPTECPS